MDGMRSIVSGITINSNIRRRRGGVTVPHPVKDLPQYLVKSIAEQSGLAL